MRARRFVVLAVAGIVGAAIFGTVMALGVAGSSKVAKFATLNGGVEVGPNGEAGAGDPNGWGGGTAIVHSNTRVCVAATWSGIAKVVAAHIHVGKPGVNGPVKVDFTPLFPKSGMINGNPGSLSGCLSVPASLGKNIRNNPGNYYFNIHTTEIPAGAIRGQVR